MIKALTLLLFLQLCGETLARLTGFPLPGPVVGMMLMLMLLLWRRRSSHELDTTAEGFLKYLALLFVPAGVGLSVYLEQLEGQWVALGVTVVLSTSITLVVTGMVMQYLLKGRA